MEKDLFSERAESYAKFRPGYPPELFEYVLSFVPEKQHAWDVGTGNGQTARALSKYFVKVIGSDISDKQLEHAATAPNIKYIQCSSDNTPIKSATIDLITVSQAYH